MLLFSCEKVEFMANFVAKFRNLKRVIFVVLFYILWLLFIILLSV